MCVCAAAVIEGAAVVGAVLVTGIEFCISYSSSTVEEEELEEDEWGGVEEEEEEEEEKEE